MQKKKSESRPKRNTKRTSARKTKSKGLGDTVEKVFKATGVGKVAKWALGEDCGCDERKEKLNNMFPYNLPNCLTEDEYEYLDAYFKSNPQRITGEQQKRLVEIRNRVFNERAKTTSCSSCFLNRTHNKLLKIYNEYKEQFNKE